MCILGKCCTLNHIPDPGIGIQRMLASQRHKHCHWILHTPVTADSAGSCPHCTYEEAGSEDLGDLHSSPGTQVQCDFCRASGQMCSACPPLLSCPSVHRRPAGPAATPGLQAPAGILAMEAHGILGAGQHQMAGWKQVWGQGATLWSSSHSHSTPGTSCACMGVLTLGLSSGAQEMGRV